MFGRKAQRIADLEKELFEAHARSEELSFKLFLLTAQAEGKGYMVATVRHGGACEWSYGFDSDGFRWVDDLPADFEPETCQACRDLGWLD